MCGIGHCAATVNLEYYIAAKPDRKRLLLILLMTTTVLMMMRKIVKTKSRLPRRTVTRTVDAKNSIRRILEAKSISTSFLFFNLLKIIAPTQETMTTTSQKNFLTLAKFSRPSGFYQMLECSMLTSESADLRSTTPIEAGIS